MSEASRKLPLYPRGSCAGGPVVELAGAGSEREPILRAFCEGREYRPSTSNCSAHERDRVCVRTEFLTTPRAICRELKQSTVLRQS